MRYDFRRRYGRPKFRSIALRTTRKPPRFYSCLRCFSGQGGYIDSALIRTNLRFRFDAAYDFDRPDRAEFFYTTWTAFGGQNPVPPNGFPEPSMDQQALWLSYEHTVSNNLSAFVDVPFVFSNPRVNRNVSALGDMRVGVKLRLLATLSPFE